MRQSSGNKARRIVLAPREAEALAQRFGVSPRLIQRVVVTRETRSLVQRHRGCPAQTRGRGNHPRLYALLGDLTAPSAVSVEPECMIGFSPEDQVVALAKDRLYDELSPALAQIWEGIGNWRSEHGRGLAVSEEIDAGGGRFSYRIRPLTRDETAALASIPGLRERVTALKRPLRALFMAINMQHLEAREKGKAPSLHTPRVLFPDAPNLNPAFLIWTGLNTALKATCRSLVLLSELWRDAHGELPDRAAWRAMANANLGFVSLLASTSLSALVYLEERWIEAPEAHRRRSDGRVAHDPRSEEPWYDRRFFRLVAGSDGVPRIDIDTVALEAVGARQIPPTVLLKRCPALKAGIVPNFYRWVRQEIEHTAGELLWRDTGTCP
jgi:hypothetical protein